MTREHKSLIMWTNPRKQIQVLEEGVVLSVLRRRQLQCLTMLNGRYVYSNFIMEMLEVLIDIKLSTFVYRMHTSETKRNNCYLKTSVKTVIN